MVSLLRSTDHQALAFTPVTLLDKTRNGKYANSFTNPTEVDLENFPRARWANGNILPVAAAWINKGRETGHLRSKANLLKKHFVSLG